MNQSIIITPQVINTINSLPAPEREIISNALASEMFLGTADLSLTPTQQLVYNIIRFNIERDTIRFNSH